MTKERKLEILKDLLVQLSDSANILCTCEADERCDVIEECIKSLEQQPYDDCVSRQAVKDGMIKYGFHAPDMTVTEFIEDELPPATPKIPTSEDCVSRADLLAQINESWETIETKLDFVNIVKALPPVIPTQKDKYEWLGEQFKKLDAEFMQTLKGESNNE